MDSGDAERCAHRDRAPEDITDVALPLDAGFTVR